MTAAVVALSDVSLTYPGPPPVDAVRGVDLSIPARSRTAVVGPSGSGKSSVLTLLGLLERPTSGEVVFAGHTTSGLSDAQLTRLRRGSVGFVFQHFHLLRSRTCVENVALAMAIQGIPRHQRVAQATDLLGRVGLGTRAQALAGELSGGESQRVAIARALVGSPQVLLCDEPTGNLDSRSSAAVLELLAEQHAHGVSIVVVTHDPVVAAWAENVVEIIDGKVRI